jgi:hypothetical protein
VLVANRAPHRRRPDASGESDLFDNYGSSLSSRPAP